MNRDNIKNESATEQAPNEEARSSSSRQQQEQQQEAEDDELQFHQEQEIRGARQAEQEESVTVRLVHATLVVEEEATTYSGDERHQEELESAFRNRSDGDILQGNCYRQQRTLDTENNGPNDVDNHDDENDRDIECGSGHQVLAQPTSQTSEQEERPRNRQEIGIGSSVVVENVVMDEYMTELLPEMAPFHHSTFVTQAIPMSSNDEEDENKRLYQNQNVWIICLVLAIGAVLAIILSSGEIVHSASNRTTPQDPQNPTPQGGALADNDNKFELAPDLGKTAETFVKYILPKYSQNALEDPTSPQSHALEWLWKDPESTGALPNFRRVQRFALATLHFAMFGTEYQEPNNVVAQQTTTDGWLSSNHECSWPTLDSPSIVCPDGDHWRTIKLSDCGAHSSFPPEIGLLTDLVSIVMSDNPGVNGTLPSEIGLLTQLDQLMVDNAALTGPIPTETGMLTNLGRLSMSNNQLSSTLPSELGRLTRMQYLILWGNRLSGIVPSAFGQMNAVQQMLFHFNGLTGTIPTELGLLSNLQLLVFSQNTMAGTIPSELGRISSLSILMLDGNNFNGTVPDELGELSDLDTLTIFDTDLSGSLPASICDLVGSQTLEQLLVNCTDVVCNCSNCDFCADLVR